MIRQKCSRSDCYAPDGLCRETATGNYRQCKYFNKEKTKPDKTEKKKSTTTIPWSGQAFQPNDIELLSLRSEPKIIGLVGSSGAGKTTFLAMLYTLLFNGKKINEWRFSGSYTLTEWELQAKSLKIKENGNATSPDTTPSAPDFYSLYHLALRNNKHLHDVLFADSSGEVFSKWAINTEDSSAENAKWIYGNAHGFYLFIDCEAIINERGRAQQKILLLAEQLKSELNNRPIVILWSKADLKNEMRSNIRKSIEQGLSELFPNALSIQISNYTKSNSEELCQVNNLLAVESMLKQLYSYSKIRVTPQCDLSSDLFFNYRGKGL